VSSSAAKIMEGRRPASSYYAHPVGVSRRSRPASGSSGLPLTISSECSSAALPPPPLPQQLLPPRAPPPSGPPPRPSLLAAVASLEGDVIPPSLARGARARAAASSGARPSIHARLPFSRREGMASFRRLEAMTASLGGSVSSSSNSRSSIEPSARTEELPSVLLQQLARCNASSDALIHDMRKSFSSRVDQKELLLQLSTRYLLVGKCDSRFAGVAKFLPTKVVYAFEHPHHRSVEMHMSYKDMLSVCTHDRPKPSSAQGGRGGGGGAPASGELRFRIAKQLAYFAREYDPADASHDLRIGFESERDFAQFREVVLPHLQRLARPGEMGCGGGGLGGGGGQDAAGSAGSALPPRSSFGRRAVGSASR
jgi:hypothetical protein